ncbi:MAG TPA: sigma factor [Myxococcaceae bacterium]|jgi:RNA polymerase sigma-70 factor (ECF subfamily)|nr:sigma factor [Myxococcaceae bacterium]
MNDRDCLAQRFEENRTHLRSVAYRMLGSSSEVDDAVQEAWLRLGRADATGIDNLGGWLTTVVARRPSTTGFSPPKPVNTVKSRSRVTRGSP